jgi:hypothetical protein
MALRTQKSTSRFPLPPNSRSPTWNVTVILSSLCRASWKHSRWWAFIWMLCEAASEMKLLAAAKTARDGNSMISGGLWCCGCFEASSWELAMRKWPGCPQSCRGRQKGLARRERLNSLKHHTAPRPSRCSASCKHDREAGEKFQYSPMVQLLLNHSMAHSSPNATLPLPSHLHSSMSSSIRRAVIIFFLFL